MLQIKLNRFFLKRVLSILMTFLLFLTPVLLGGCSKDEDDGSGYTFTYALDSNPKNLDPQIATDRSSLMIIENMFLGLMTFDDNNKLVCGAALDYDISEDGLRYHFNLRDDCMWYSSDGTTKKVTAHDFVFAFKRIFNPVTLSPYRETFSFLQNASQIIDGKEDYSKLGVYALNANELVFYLDRASSEFLYLLTTAPAMPCNKEFFESTKARYGLDDKSVISNGAFYISQWFYDRYGNDNLIYMKKNSLNSEYDRVYPYILKFNILNNKEEVFDQFKNETTDVVIADRGFNKSLTGSSCTSVRYQNKSMGIIFSKNSGVDPIVRKELALGIDRAKTEEVLNDYFDAAYGLVPGSLGESGAEYRKAYDEKSLDIYSESGGITQAQADKFYSRFENEPSIMILQSMDSGFMNQIAAQWQDNLNLYIGIDYVDEKEYKERIDSGDYVMALAELESLNDSVCGYMQDAISQLNIPDSSIVNISKQFDGYISDMTDNSTDYLFKAENQIIDSGSYIPVFYTNEYLVSKNEVKDLIFNPFSGQINFRYAKYFG